MTENAFIRKATQPTPRDLAAKLGPTKDVWNQLVKDITKSCGISEKEWTSYSPKAGWALRLKRKKRNIVYLSPCAGCFWVTFVLGDKAMKAARNTDFSPSVARIIAEAPKYPEGSGIRLEITSAAECEAVRKLAEIKVAN